MTDPNKTAIQLLVDRSGSMQSIRADMQGAINSFVEKQAKEPGEALLWVSDFDDDVVHRVHGADIHKAQAHRHQQRAPHRKAHHRNGHVNMSAQSWSKRREFKRAVIAMHHVLRGAPRKDFTWKGTPMVILGPNHPLFRFLVEK